MSDKWTRDTGLVFALLFLVLGSRGNRFFLLMSGVFLLVLLFAPNTLGPLAKGWMRLAEILGAVMNKVFFGLVFFLVVVPVGYCKRLFDGDTRDLQKHPARTSAFVEDARLFTKTVFERPY